MREDAFQAELLTAEVESIRSETRMVLSADSWRWLAIWSVVCLGAGLSAIGPWADTLAPRYWMVAAPLGMGATAVVGFRYERTKGVRSRGWPYWAVGAAMGVLMSISSAFLPDDVLVIWVWVVMGTGFAIMSGFDGHRRGRTTFLAAVGTTVAAAFLVGNTFIVYALAGIGFGVTMAWLSHDARPRP